MSLEPRAQGRRIASAPGPAGGTERTGELEERGRVVTVRPLGPADVEACAAIMSDLALWREYGVTIREARDTFAAALRGAAQVQVAEDGTRVVGFVEYLARGTFGHSGYVWAVGVAADAQGRGVGGRLMDAAEAEIFKAGPNVFLLVNASNPGAQRFYERRGYRRVGELTDYMRPGLTEILYRKTLGPIRAGGA
jgi:ribosomal protein S18 acetylase RimI-like enzyme